MSIASQVKSSLPEAHNLKALTMYSLEDCKELLQDIINCAERFDCSSNWEDIENDFMVQPKYDHKGKELAELFPTLLSEVLSDGTVLMVLDPGQFDED
jgi:hypothetical protein